MITKAGEHDTDRAGRVIFTSAIQKLNMVANPTTDDYGTDYHVQVFDGANPNGSWFQVQLKSTSSLPYSADGSYLSYSIEIDHLVHYAIDLKHPIFIVLVDVQSERIFWVCPQLDAKLIEQAKTRGQQSLTIRFPIIQELPQGAAAMMENLRQIYLLLSARELMNTTAGAFQGVLCSLPDQEKMHAAFQEKNDVLRLQRAANSYRDGRFEEAMSRAETVANDLDASTEAKFHAITQLNVYEFRRAFHSDANAKELAAVERVYARRLRRIASGQSWVKYASVLVSLAARIQELVFEDGADYMALQQHLHARANLDAVIRLSEKRNKTTRSIIATYNRAYRIAMNVQNHPDRWALGRVITRIPIAIATYLISLRSSLQTELEAAYVKSSLDILELAAQISKEVGDNQGIGMAASAATMLANNETSPAFLWGRSLADAMPDGEERESIQEIFRRTAARWRGEPQSGDHHADTTWQIIQKLALSMGVSIADEASVFVKRLRIAARDDSPERVLRFCEHTVVALGAVSQTASKIHSEFGISTSGNKVVFCNLFEFHREGTEMDTAFESFREQYCDACAFRKPRPAHWTYSKEFEREYQRENLAILRKASENGYGLRFVATDDLDPAE